VVGNARLTTLTGALLLAPLALEGLTILRIGQLLWLHMFVGLLLIGPIGLKLASTGYRFGGYYARRAAYVRKGPPVMPLRLLAIPLVASTVVMLTTGVLLLLEGPGSRDRLLVWHKVSFIVWIVFAAVHVLAHVAELPRSLRDDLTPLQTGTPRVGRRGLRLLMLATAVLLGVVIALVALPDFGAWQHAEALRHLHRG
jgi:hypothetical protein